MKPVILAGITAIVLSAGAAQHPAKNYQDGVLMAVHTIVTGSSCSGSADTTANAYGNTVDATTTASAHCSDVRRFIYTVQVGDTKYDLTPEHSAGASTAAAISPIGLLLIRRSSLHDRLPGTAVKLRSDGGGIYVLVGKRETGYTVFGGGQ